MQNKSIISKGKYSFAQAENIVSVRQYFFVRDEGGQKRLLLRFCNDRNETCTGFAFVVRFLDSRGRVIDEEEYESGTISVGSKRSFAFEEAIFVDERCCNFKVEVLHAYYGNYKYINENGAVSVGYEQVSETAETFVNLSKIKAPRRVKTRFFKLPMVYVWIALAILTLAVIALSVQLLIFKLTEHEFTLDGIEYEFVSDDKENGEVVITGHSGGHTSLLIPAEIEGHKVIGISSGAFENNKKIKRVRIEGVDVGQGAFLGCKNLSEVQIDSVSKIGEDAFNGCESLKVLTITSEKDNILDIGKRAFANCFSLKEASIDQLAVYKRGSVVFENDYNIETLKLKNFAFALSDYDASEQASTIKELFTSSEDFMMMSPKLRTLKIDYINSISSRFCADFAYLTSFEIKETSVSEIESHAFYNCISLAKVDFKSPVSKVEEKAFANTAIKKFNGTELSQIGNYAFENCRSLEHFNLSGNETLSRIGECAFRNCQSLESIVLPSSLTKISTGAFEGCGLRSFTLSSASTAVERGALSDCIFIEELNLAYIPNGYIGYMFGYSKADLSIDSTELEGIRKVKIFGEKSEIDSYAFAYCSGLQTVSLANSVTDIGDMAFYNCESLSGINLGESIETIGESAFYNCKELSEINLGNNLISIESYAFEGSGIKAIIIPPEVTVGEGILLDCFCIEEVTLPIGNEGIGQYFSSSWEQLAPPLTLKKITVNGGTAIDSYAFYGCDNVEEITLCEGITAVYRAAFDGCYQLRKLILPSTLELFEYGAVEGCYKLYEICNQSELVDLAVGSEQIPYTLSVSTSLDEMAPTVRVDDCYFAKYQNRWYLINWERDAQALSPAAEFTYNGAGGRSEDVDEWSIPRALFYKENSNITELKLPASVNEVGDMAFRECLNQISIKFDKNADISSIGDACFYNSVYVKSVVLPNSVKEIGANAFKNCYGLESVDMPTSLETIGSSAFESCQGLKSIVLHEKVRNVEQDAFVGCSSLYDIYNLSSISIVEGSDDYSSVARYGFVHTSLDAPMSSVVTVSGVGEFRNSGNKWILTYLDFSVTEFYTDSLKYRGKSFDTIRIGERAAEYRDQLKTVVFGKNVTQIQEEAFEGCYNLRYVDLSNTSIDEIENEAFSGCSRMIELKLPQRLKRIGSYAFENCSKLLSIELPSSLEAIGTEAFYGCVELFEVYNFSSSISVGKNTNNGYVGYYARRFLTSIFDIPLERIIENGMYFVRVDNVYYLHHLDNVISDGGVLEIPNVGLEMIITPDVFYECNATSIVIPSNVTQIDYSGNESALETVYYGSDYESWNEIERLNSPYSNVFYYDICVHEYGKWTYVDGKISTNECELSWVTEKEPTCESSGYKVGSCMCKNGCQYKEQITLYAVGHEIKNDACVHCNKKYVKLTSSNLDLYSSQFEITTEKFTIDKDGKATPDVLEYGDQGSLIITAKENTVIEFDITVNSNQDFFRLYYDYGYGYVYSDEISGHMSTTRTVRLSKGESYIIVFDNGTYSSSVEYEASGYLTDIKILVKSN